MKKVTHYFTAHNNLLCLQKHSDWCYGNARFSFKIGQSHNCKNCERILKNYAKNSNNKCVSFEKLGYNTDCQWRDINNKCNCIDDCAHKLIND